MSLFVWIHNIKVIHDNEYYDDYDDDGAKIYKCRLSRMQTQY
jgi:hypothetical protein